MAVHIVEEKFPFLDRPTARFVLAPAKRARKGSDQIELFSETRQRLKRADPVGDALDPEKIDQLVRKRIKIDIHADAAVTELFGEKKEKSRAAAKIENLLRRRAIEFQFLNAWKIDCEPVLDVSVLCVTGG